MRWTAAALGVALLAASLGACGPAVVAPVSDAGHRQDDRPRVVRIVRPGDTLYSIAFDAGMDYRAVARWNRIGPPYLIIPGQRLRLRPPPGDPGRPETVARQPAAPPASGAGAGNDPPTQAAAPRPDSAPARGQTDPPQHAAPAPGHWLWPARGQIIRQFSRDSANPGIDIAGRGGQPVQAAAAGRVVYSGDGLRGYGKLIIVKHDEIFLSAYAHNRKLLVREGDQVQRGQPIAEMGSTDTDRVKLHFEIRKRGTAVDPLQYLSKT